MRWRLQAISPIVSSFNENDMKNLKNLTKEELSNVANNMTVSVGYMVTPEDMGCESGKRIKIGAPMTPVQLSELGQQVRSEVHLIGSVVNFACENGIREAISAIKHDAPRMFRHDVKKACNECQAILRSWRSNMKGLLGERFDVVEDMAIERLSEIQPDINMLAAQIEQRLLHAKCPGALKLATTVSIVDFLLTLSQTVVNCIVDQWWKSHGIDFSEVFAHMNLQSQCGSRWNIVRSKFYDTKIEDAVLTDTNVQCAITICSQKLSDYNAIFPHMKTVIGEYGNMFGEEEKADLDKDINNILREQDDERKAEERKNRAYWKKVRKPKASDVSDDDLELLKRHFSA